MKIRKDLIIMLSSIVPEDVSFFFTPPENSQHGDLSTSVAFVLAKILKKSPLVIAQELCDHLLTHPLVDKTEQTAGYVNVILNNSVWEDVLKNILTNPLTYGHHTFGKGQKISVEYVSANPTGPLHAAHSRGAIMGDVAANLLEAVGYEVEREYFINDAGHQIHQLAETVYMHYEAMVYGKTAVIPSGFYPGDYVREIAEKIFKEKGGNFLSKPKSEILPIFASFAVRVMMDDIQQDLQALNIHHTVFTSEKALQKTGLIEKMVAFLKEKDLIYEGVLPPPKGQDNENWQPKNLLLFRSSAFGDTQDRPLQREDGTWTYFASDIAYHFDKVMRGYSGLIDVWGADHASHVLRMQAAVSALTNKTLEVMLYQMVHFFHQGVLLKMSKRAGTFISLKDILDMIDQDVLRFMMLTKKADTHLDLDIALMKEQTKSNPVFYVQYAYARCCSVFRAALSFFQPEQLTFSELKKSNFARLEDFTIIKLLADWPRQIEYAAQMREPHRITSYLYQLATAFHGLWQQGTENVGLRFLNFNDQEVSLARLGVVKAVGLVIASGFKILGIHAKEEMH